MTGKKFMNTVANGKEDILQIFLNILKRTKTAYCIVGGLAVNAFVEPVVSLDLDVVIESKDIDKVSKEIVGKGFKVERFEHSMNLTSSKSDLRIQIQTDSRYQEFLSRASSKEVLGYKMNVASIEDVLQGKVWAYSDEKRRMSKRQKDLADIIRLIEAYPSLERLIPSIILEKLK
ncbi:MAG: hypothetical protein OEY25_06430 [Candidatus Aminicenantes bacterium]|nr:hypothetical protein [Candidatus Aminicenantes bacterium]MDH5705746.1 hypothetical protein [Candidatus Aminicenantes bacterium]